MAAGLVCGALGPFGHACTRAPHHLWSAHRWTSGPGLADSVLLWIEGDWPLP